jgi:hypothetical protein
MPSLIAGSPRGIRLREKRVNIIGEALGTSQGEGDFKTGFGGFRNGWEA